MMKRQKDLSIPEEIQAVLYSTIQFQSDQTRIFQSDNYNYAFNPENGSFLRWGVTAQEDPEYSPFGPELLDIEISTICHGIHGRNCAYCYKNNQSQGKNMDFTQFQSIFAKIPSNVMQIAFGIGDLDGNPDLIQILEFCRDNPYHSVVPNITINGSGFSEQWAKNLSRLCGAVAVSHYDDAICFSAVKLLHKNGCKQVNIHQMIAEETYDQALQLIAAIQSDQELRADVYSVVFLALKQKGKGATFHPLSEIKFLNLINTVLDAEILLGFDTCSAFRVLQAMENHSSFKKIQQHIESCESGLFSGYINVDGQFFPCSFLEETEIFPSGIDILAVSDFMTDVWNHHYLQRFRHNLIAQSQKNRFNCRICPHYKI